MIKFRKASHRDNHYQYPNVKYVCGQSTPCKIGPDQKGKCQGCYGCVPENVDGEWQCRIADGSARCAGGPSETGECCLSQPPCQPKLHHRQVRGRWGYLAWIFTLGLLLLMFSGSWLNMLIEPGKLNSAHSTGEFACGMCHEQEQRKNLFQLVAYSFEDHPITDINQQCLTCHVQGDHADMPHSIDTFKLEESTQRLVSTWPFSESKRHSEKQSQPIACIACHKEHKGERSDLLDVSNAQCDACHIEQFKNMEGHPEFTQYPFDRRTRILFDHNTHIGKHFKGKKSDLAPTHCNSCHTLEARGMNMKTASFESSCGGCHQDQIGKKSLDIVGIPKLDSKTLDKEGYTVGTWSKKAKKSLPPLMTLLLEPQGGEALFESLGDAKLSKLSKATDEQLKASQELVLEIKLFLATLSDEKKAQKQLIKMLEQSTGEELDKMAVSSLPEFPAMLLENQLKYYLPGLKNEVKLIKSKKLDELNSLTEVAAEKPIFNEIGQWSFKSGMLRYTPKYHSDPLIKQLLKLTENGDSESSAQVFDLLTSEKQGAGSCAKCHSVDEQDGKQRFNWTAKYHQERHEKVFTQFDHSAHFPLMKENDICSTCHELGKGESSKDDYEGNNPDMYTSNFLSLEKSACASCHKASEAGDQCTQCHNYHIGEFDPMSLHKLQ